MEITLLKTRVDYAAKRNKYFNSYYDTVWYTGEPIILAREILILHLFSGNTEMTVPDIYIKKQINLSLLLLLKWFLPGLTETFLKSRVLEIEVKRAEIILY